MTTLAPLFYMLGVVFLATVGFAVVANIAADLWSSNRLKPERRIWKR